MALDAHAPHTFTMNSETAHRLPARNGVLLINLGTPAAPTAAAIRSYLRQFLSDRRVVELWRPLWLTILYAFILPFRPGRLVRAYQKVWGAQGSPLMSISRAQEAALRSALGNEVSVALAMTYGEPSVNAALSELESAGVRRVLVLPLYPQYSGTTTAAAFDALFDALRERRWMPEIRTVGSYHDDPAYIAALARSIEAHGVTQGRADHLLMSFHSIPRRYLEQGDPYYCQCQKTARLLAEQLKLAPESWSISFQSRLGRQPWLMPYTDMVVPQLARRGVKTLDVICPGFSADCLETLEEVAIRYAEDFQAAGGTRLRYIPALNADEGHIAALTALCRRHLQGWNATTESAAEVAQRPARVEAALACVREPLLKDR